MTIDERIIGDLIHDLSYRQLALEWTSIDEHWASSCADADGAFVVDCLAAAGFAAGNQYQYCIPLCLPPMLNGRRLPHQNLSIFGFWFRGDYWGSGMGAGWSCPHIYRHIRYMCHLCSIAIGRQDFRLLTSNGVSALLYLSYI